MRIMQIQTYKPTMFYIFGSHGGVDEKCVMRSSDGAFIGVKTGKVYDKETHITRPKRLAKVVSTDQPFETGMVHLDEKEGMARRAAFAGCVVFVEEAHISGDMKVYWSPDIEDYFTEKELEFV